MYCLVHTSKGMNRYLRIILHIIGLFVLYIIRLICLVLSHMLEYHCISLPETFNLHQSQRRRHRTMLFTSCGYQGRKAEKASTKEELLPSAWHPSRYWDLCVPQDEKQGIKKLWV